MIYILNLRFNPDDALEYAQLLATEYSKLKWEYRKHHNDPRGIEDKNVMDNVSGWGLQTIYNDPLFPYHCDIDPHDEGPEYFKDTALVFGFFERVKKLFSTPYRSFLMTFPPKHYIGKWLPGGPPHGKVFIPIVTNDRATITNLTTNQALRLELGKIYMFDMTTNYGEFKNDGDTEIQFITFNVPYSIFTHVLNLKGTV